MAPRTRTPLLGGTGRHPGERHTDVANRTHFPGRDEPVTRADCPSRSEVSREGARMTAAEWDLSRERNLMLISAHTAGRLSDRVLRLAACACCRPIAHLFEDRRCLTAVT